MRRFLNMKNHLTVKNRKNRLLKLITLTLALSLAVTSFAACGKGEGCGNKAGFLKHSGVVHSSFSSFL